MGLASLKNIPITGYAIKAAGVAAAALVAYDAHSYGKIKGEEEAQNSKTNSLETASLNKLCYENPSIVQNKLRDKMFAYKADDNIFPFFNNLKGYIKGVGEMILNDAIPLGLAMGAILTPTKHAFVSKAFGLGLLVYGAAFVAEEFLGLGRKNRLSE